VRKRPTITYKFGDGTTHTLPAGDVEALRRKQLERYAELTGDRGPLESELDRSVIERLAAERHRLATKKAGEARSRGRNASPKLGTLQSAVEFALLKIGANADDAAVLAFLLKRKRVALTTRRYDITRSRASLRRRKTATPRT
jgi:hypothetical protein